MPGLGTPHHRRQRRRAILRSPPGSFGMAELREAMLDGNGDLIPRPLALHVHLPGTGRCAGCRVRWHPGPGADATDAPGPLASEVAAALALADPDRPVVAVHYVCGPDGAGLGDVASRLRQLVSASSRPSLGWELLTVPAGVTPEGIRRAALAGVDAVEWRGPRRSAVADVLRERGFVAAGRGLFRRASGGRPPPSGLAVDLLPAGPGACGRVGIALWRNIAAPRSWLRALAAGRLPASRGRLRRLGSAPRPARLDRDGRLHY